MPEKSAWYIWKAPVVGLYWRLISRIWEGQEPSFLPGWHVRQKTRLTLDLNCLVLIIPILNNCYCLAGDVGVGLDFLNQRFPLKLIKCAARYVIWKYLSRKVNYFKGHGETKHCIQSVLEVSRKSNKQHEGIHHFCGHIQRVIVSTY